MVAISPAFDPSTIAHNGAVIALMDFSFAGVPIFPCDDRPNAEKGGAPSKAPLVRGSWKDAATADLDQLMNLFHRPTALIGLPCGQNGMIVIDCDRRPGKPDGVAAFEALIEKHGGLPSGVVVVETQSGGRHYCFRQPEGLTLGNSTGDLPQSIIDVRGDGGYIVAPGSILADGRGWREAEGSPKLVDALAEKTLPEPPEWLLTLLRAPKTAAESVDASGGDNLASEPSKPLSERARASGPANSAEAISYEDSEEVERAYIEAAIACIPADDRDDWLKVGGALHDKFGDAGRSIWDAWSQTSPNNYDSADQDKTWRSFSRLYSGDPVGIGTIIMMARERGFEGRKAEYAPKAALPEWMVKGEGILADKPAAKSRQPKPAVPVLTEDEFRAAARKSTQIDPGADYADRILDMRGNLVADIAEWTLSVSQIPHKRFAVAVGLAVVSVAASRQMVSPTDASLNLHQIAITPTANGKDVVVEAPKAILAAAGLASTIGPSGMASGIAIYTRLQQHPVTLSAIDEFGDVLTVMSGGKASAHMAQVPSELKKFHNGRVLASQGAVTRPDIVLHRPCLSLITASTPKQFFDAVGNKESADGSLNRFILHHVDRIGAFQNPAGRLGDVPESIASRVRDIAERLRVFAGDAAFARFRTPNLDSGVPAGVFVVPWRDDEAEAVYKRYRDQFHKVGTDGTDRAHELAGRLALNANKIATVLAVGENAESPSVSAEHFNAAAAIMNASFADMTSRLANHVPENFDGTNIDTVVEFVRSQPGGMILHKDILDHFRNTRARDKMQKMIISLVDAGAIEAVEIHSGRKGRPVKAYRYCGGKKPD